MSTNNILTAQEAVSLLKGMNYPMLRALLIAKIIPSKRIGYNFAIAKDDIVSFVEKYPEFKLNGEEICN